MIRINQLKSKYEIDIKDLASLEKKLKLFNGEIIEARISKLSIDARRKPDVFRVYSIDVKAKMGDEKFLRHLKQNKFDANIVSCEEYELPKLTRFVSSRPVVCGFGPCGIFAALVLAKAGLRPIVLERGMAMDDRINCVENFWANGILNPCSNVQFGEGGAGTFSDGKLTTGTKDKAQSFVLKSFVAAGAEEKILYWNKPHIGTDVLRNVVVNLRKEIERLGGEIRFNSTLTGIEIHDGKLKGVYVNTTSFIECEYLVLGLGHSARDTVRMLHKQNFLMEQKQFSMGVRIEHKQELVNYANYGAADKDFNLPPADYKLNVRLKNGRGAYTFCMCPGGYVVASASEEGKLVTNGMSNSNRSGENANSALLVDVLTDDFQSDHPLAGIAFQEKYEEAAFKLGGSSYKAPAERVGDFLSSKDASEVVSDGLVDATYKPGVVFTDIRKALPTFVAEGIKEALPMLGRKIKGFDDRDAVLTAIESRSSAPYRMKRNIENRMALNQEGDVIYGVFPAGEGAGYAGGIMSSAVDGIHAAEEIIKHINGGK